MRHVWTPVEERFGQMPGMGRWLPLLDRHAALVEEASERTNLTAVAPEDMVLRHYVESLHLLEIILRHAAHPARIVDIGSGAGFPGLVLAALLEEAEITLIEPRAKRAEFLTAATDAMALTNVEVVRARAEEAGRGPLRGRADVVTARAVAPLAVLVEYAAPLAAPGGLMAFPKGSRVQAEIDEAAEALTALHAGLVEVVTEDEPPAVVVLRQEGAAPARFPRRTGVAAHRPLGNVRRSGESA